MERTWRYDVLSGLVVYAITLVPVVVGLMIAARPGAPAWPDAAPDTLDRCCHFDGGFYRHIATDGYQSPDPEERRIAFFPGYPLLVHVLVQLTGCSLRNLLLITANASFLAALVLLAMYLRAREAGDRQWRFTTLLLVGLYPAGYFFRMAYSESLFLALVALFLLGFARQWPVWLLAAIAGASTGVRASGAAASICLLVWIVADRNRGSRLRRLAIASLVGPLTVWGLLAFMAYQYVEFGSPLAFVEAHSHWVNYTPEPGDIAPGWLRLLLAEPIWNAYIPGSPRHWEIIDHQGPFQGLAFWNPLLFTCALLAVCAGWYLGWLNRVEGMLGLGLLIIPYLTRADEMSMVSQSRFVSVAIPMYLVLGRLCTRCPAIVRWLLFAGMAVLLGLWSALFALGWPLF